MLKHIFRDIHREPHISKLLCRLDRHDYEGVGFQPKVLSVITGRVVSPAYVDLACFYCGKRKRSFIGT